MVLSKRKTYKRKHLINQTTLGFEVGELINSLKNDSNRRFSFWEEVVGTKISQVAVPMKTKKSILFVKVQDSIWRFELTRRKDEIIKKINEHLKKNSIRDIVFI